MGCDHYFDHSVSKAVGREKFAIFSTAQLALRQAVGAIGVAYFPRPIIRIVAGRVEASCDRGSFLV